MLCFTWFICVLSKECNELNSSLSDHSRFSAEPVGLLSWYSLNRAYTGLWLFPWASIPCFLCLSPLAPLVLCSASHPQSARTILCQLVLFSAQAPRLNNFPQICYAVTCLISFTPLLTEDRGIHDGEEFVLPRFSFMTCAVLGVSREWEGYSCVNELMKTAHFVHTLLFMNQLFLIKYFI